MAFHKADIGCRPEAQYTYDDGCCLAIRVGHEGAHAARAPSTRDTAAGVVPPEEWMATGTGEVYGMRTSADERYRPHSALTVCSQPYFDKVAQHKARAVLATEESAR
jgi:hypothetical protein